MSVVRICLYLTLFVTGKLIYFSLILQNFISYVVVVLLVLCGADSVERLNWKLISVWIPVNIIFIGILIPPRPERVYST